jgi:hypothetical protein
LLGSADAFRLNATVPRVHVVRSAGVGAGSLAQTARCRNNGREGILLALLAGLLVAGKLGHDELEPLKQRVAPGLLAGFHPRGGCGL